MTVLFQSDVPPMAPLAGRNIGIVVKSYNDPHSFHTRRRVLPSMEAVADVARRLNPNADKIVAMYPTIDPVGGWIKERSVR